MKLAWIYDTSACVDCYMTVGIGSPSDDPDYVPTVVPLSNMGQGERVELGHKFPQGDPDSYELGFSWNACETCGSTLGGDRFAVSVWEVRA
jgi:hypothetical protein